MPPSPCFISEFEFSTSSHRLIPSVSSPVPLHSITTPKSQPRAPFDARAEEAGIKGFHPERLVADLVASLHPVENSPDVATIVKAIVSATVEAGGACPAAHEPCCGEAEARAPTRVDRERTHSTGWTGPAGLTDTNGAWVRGGKGGL